MTEDDNSKVFHMLSYEHSFCPISGGLSLSALLYIN